MPSPIPAFVNPDSGSADDARAVLRDDPRFVLREVGPAELPTAVRAAVDAGAPRVLVSGGDGTLAGVADALLGSAGELAILPGGTLNHFARDLGLPRDDLPACVELAATGTARPLDVGSVNGRVFLSTSSVGAYVSFVRLRERVEPWLGYALASVVAAVRVWLGIHGFDVVVADGDERRRYRTPLLYVGVGERALERRELGARVAGGARALHVFVVRDTTRARLLARSLVAIARGAQRLAEAGGLESRFAPDFTAVLRRPWGRVAIDGELVRLRAPLEYRYLPDALRVVAPDAPVAAEDAPAATAAVTT